MNPWNKAKKGEDTTAQTTFTDIAGDTAVDTALKPWANVDRHLSSMDKSAVDEGAAEERSIEQPLNPWAKVVSPHADAGDISVLNDALSQCIETPRDADALQDASATVSAAQAVWICPNCASALQLVDKTWHCANKHSFDTAKQGYVHLQLANQKKSALPGDSSDMIDARRAFLYAGHYQPLVARIHQLAAQHLVLEGAVMQPSAVIQEASPVRILDLGCGEGYYLQQLMLALAASNEECDSVASAALPCAQKPQWLAQGIDVSKVGVKRAASSHKHHSEVDVNWAFAVASTYSIPVADNTVDFALSIFAPFSATDVARVLAKDGILLRVSPGPRHLYEIKQRLYNEVTLHQAPAVSDAFQLLEQQLLTFTTHFERGEKGAVELAHLLAMTPLNWHGHSDAKQELLGGGGLDLTCEFYLQVLQPNVGSLDQ